MDIKKIKDILKEKINNIKEQKSKNKGKNNNVLILVKNYLTNYWTYLIYLIIVISEFLLVYFNVFNKSVGNAVDIIKVYLLFTMIIHPVYYVIVNEKIDKEKIKFKEKLISFIILLNIMFICSMLPIYIFNIFTQKIYLYISVFFAYSMFSYIYSAIFIFIEEKTKYKSITLIVMYILLFIVYKLTEININLFNIFEPYIIGIIPIFEVVLVSVLMLWINKQLNTKKSMLAKIINVISLVLIILAFVYVYTNNLKYKKIIDLTKEQSYIVNKEIINELKDDENLILYISYKNTQDININATIGQVINNNIRYINGFNYLSELNNLDIKDKYINAKKIIESEIEKNKEFKENTIHILKIPRNNENIKYIPIYPIKELTKYIPELGKIKSTFQREFFLPIIAQKNVTNKTDIGMLIGHEEFNEYDAYEAVLDLEKYGNKLDKINLEKDIPDNIKNILILSPMVDLKDDELAKMMKFIENGGNIIYMHQNMKTEDPLVNFRKLLDVYGVKIIDGQIIEGADSHRYIYNDKNTSNTLKKELTNAYQTQKSIDELLKIQEKLKNSIKTVDNSIIFLDVNKNSEAFKDLAKQGAYITSIIPSILQIDITYQKENHIENEVFLQTTDKAILYEKYIKERENIYDINQLKKQYPLYFALHNNDYFAVGTTVTKEVNNKKKTKAIIVANTSFILSNIQKDISNSNTVYKYSNNAEVFISMVNNCTNKMPKGNYKFISVDNIKIESHEKAAFLLISVITTFFILKNSILKKKK